MLSNPPTTTNLHSAAAAQRRRQHRRQNSTPSAFETVKIQKSLPKSTRPAVGAHRRGLSLDTRRQPLIAAKTAHSATTSPTATTAGQDFSPVSIATTNGLTASHPQHQFLREAQQQRTQARPGPHQFVFGGNQQPQPQNEHDSFLVSPQGNPQTPMSCFDPGSMQFDQFLAMQQQKNQAGFANNMASDFFAQNSAMSTPTYVDFHESPAAAQGWISEGDTASTRRTSRRISNGIMDRVSKFENMGMEENQRPLTPPNQNENSYFPPTPMETPHDQAKQTQRPNRFSHGYDESMEETIKPNRRSNQGAQTIFDDLRRQAEAQAAVPTPPRSNTMPNLMGMGNDGFMDMNNFNSEFMKIHGGYDGIDGLPSELSSQQTVTGVTHVGPFDNLPDLRPHDATSMPPSPTHSSRRNSPHRRTESLASIASAASIADINIEETKTETGVTLDEIATYIQGPDPADNKWICLYEECGKKFGRKENIKSHVQTHLNDRQYQCPSCKKCFVRQHDLKRHAKIHTGIKPYPCECGNSFARHDALTRHRQRGMCIGAFDGIVRKVVKRGRPRKNRPDLETRMDKASRTRKKNLSISSVSSQSGCSDSSAPNSPRNDFDMLDNDFDIMDVAMDHNTIGGGMLPVSSAAMPTMPTLTADMPNLQDYANSPESTHAHESHHSYVSPEAIMEPPPNLPPHPSSPAKSVSSQINEPPELSQSSSPPPCRMFDVEPNTSGTDDTSTLSAFVPITTAGARNLSGTLTVGVQDDEMLIKSYTNDDRLLQLDRDSSMFMMSKFDEEYGVSMLENDDMFFGTN